MHKLKGFCNVSNIFLLIAVIMLVIYAAFYSVDGIEITLWCRKFLDFLFAGDIREYANFLSGNNYNTNYNAFQILVASIPLIPWYFLHKLTTLLGFQTDVTFFGFKMDVMLICLMDGALLSRIAGRACIFFTGKELPKELKKKDIMLLFLLNTAIWMGNIVYGQIDCFECLFLFLFLNCFVKGQYIGAAFFVSCCLSLKSLSIFWLIPLIALNISKVKKEIFKKNLWGLYIGKMTAALLSMRFLNWLLENVIILNYTIMKQKRAVAANHLAKLFSNDIGLLCIPILSLVIVTLLCIYFGLKSSKNERRFLITVIPSVAFIMFSRWYPQYLTCMFVPVLLSMLIIRESVMIIVLNIIYNVGFLISWLIMGENALDNTMIKNGPLSTRLHIPDKLYTVAESVRNVSEDFVTYSQEAGIALLVGGILSALILVWYQGKHPEELDECNCCSVVWKNAALGGLLFVSVFLLGFSLVAIRIQV